MFLHLTQHFLVFLETHLQIVSKLILSRYDAERDIPAVCNTSDINEELGLVTHLFTDKTGKNIF